MKLDRFGDQPDQKVGVRVISWLRQIAINVVLRR